MKDLTIKTMKEAFFIFVLVASMVTVAIGIMIYNNYDTGAPF